MQQFLIVRFSLVCFLMLSASTLFSQFKIVPNALVFGNADETQKDSLQVTIYNDLPFDLKVNEVVPFDLYDTYAFSTFPTIFTVSAYSSAQVWVYFSPDQNMQYEQVLVFQTESRGAITLNVKGQGVFSNSYYSTTKNKTEEVLKTTFNTLLAAGYSDKGYSGARDKMYGSIDNVNGDVECVYTGRTATFNTRPGANANSFNCEHTWPQSLFNSNTPMRSDIHHLYPTDVNANSQRGSLPFGVVTGTPSWQMNGSKKGGGKFEPRDVHKGAVARSMLYFPIRYQNYSGFLTSQEAILRTWHDAFPPSAKDIQRNNDIYSEQNNRNPFVDYPQFIKRINSISTTSAASVLDSVYVSTDTVYFKNLVTQDSLIHHVSIYNAGNRDFTLQSFNQNVTTDFKVLNPPNNVVLAPGEHYDAEVFLDKPFPGIYPILLMTDKGNRNVYAQTAPGLELDEWIAERITSYPNPTIDHIKLFAPINENLSYQVLDARGNILINRSFRSSTVVDTRRLPWGNYYLSVYRYSRLYVQPIIKTSR
jgi:hypothetical protein